MKQLIQEGELEFQFLIGNLIIDGNNWILEQRKMFQFLIGNLIMKLYELTQSMEECFNSL